MTGTPSAILTLGLGPWGSVGLSLTLGYGVGEAVTTENRPVCGTLAVAFAVNGALAVSPVVNGTLALEDC